MESELPSATLGHAGCQKNPWKVTPHPAPDYCKPEQVRQSQGLSFAAEASGEFVESSVRPYNVRMCQCTAPSAREVGPANFTALLTLTQACSQLEGPCWFAVDCCLGSFSFACGRKAMTTIAHASATESQSHPGIQMTSKDIKGIEEVRGPPRSRRRDSFSLTQNREQQEEDHSRLKSALPDKAREGRGPKSCCEVLCASFCFDGGGGAFWV